MGRSILTGIELDLGCLEISTFLVLTTCPFSLIYRRFVDDCVRYERVRRIVSNSERNKNEPAASGMSVADENEDGRTTPASIRKEKMQAYPSPKKGQGITCTVRLLDGSDYEAQIDKRAKGQQVGYSPTFGSSFIVSEFPFCGFHSICFLE